MSTTEIDRRANFAPDLDGARRIRPNELASGGLTWAYCESLPVTRTAF